MKPVTEVRGHGYHRKGTGEPEISRVPPDQPVGMAVKGHHARCARLAGTTWMMELAPLAQTRLQPRQFGGQIALDLSDINAHDLVAPRLQPSLPRGAFGGDGFGLARIDQLDRDPVHEGDKIRDVAADGGLPLELAGKAAGGGQGLPQGAP